MDPTLQRGDLLLVEKFPGSFERTRKGDIVLFKPPPSLEEIIRSRGGNTGSANPLGGESLFVKRLVGVPGDTDIIMNSNTNEHTKKSNKRARHTYVHEVVTIVNIRRDTITDAMTK